MRKLILTILIYFTLSFALLAQSVNEYIKSEYLISFGKFISGYNYNHGDTFLIGYYGRNMAQYNVLIDYVKNRKIKGRKVVVLELKRLKQVEKIKPQILFVAKDKCKEIKRIYRHISGKHILMVSDYCKKDESFIMLNFLPLLYVKLQINEALLEREGFKVPKFLAAFAAKYKNDWKDLFSFTEDSLKKEKETVKQQKEILKKLEADIKQQQKELEEKKKEIKAKIAETDSLQKEITKKENTLAVKENQLNEILKELEQKQRLLKEKDQEAKLKQKILDAKISAINKLEKELKAKRKVLKQQTKKIQEQNAEISTFAEKIQKQKLINSFITILSVLLGIFLLFITYHYIHKRKANRLLAEQNAQILQQKEEIQAQADQLEEKNRLLIDLNEEIKQQANELFEANQKLTELNEQIKKQKEHIEHTHNELKSSIHYAERIQKSILPKNDSLEGLIKEFFVIYLPKDIVSGDFYWWINTQNKLYVGVADCTGHGVPGAFMSMLGVSLLHNIVKENPNQTPGEVLNQLRNNVIEALSQTQYNKQKDGMDMALIAIDKKNNLIEFAGANNPAYIVTEKLGNCTTNCEKIKTFEDEKYPDKILFELKPDKMPIGIYDKLDNFTTITLEYKENMNIYLFSDGYADQFGGEKGKKYKYKPLKKLFLSVANYSLDKQKEIISQEFENWKGSNEQVDDVTILGIKT